MFLWKGVISLVLETSPHQDAEVLNLPLWLEMRPLAQFLLSPDCLLEISLQASCFMRPARDACLVLWGILCASLIRMNILDAFEEDTQDI